MVKLVTREPESRALRAYLQQHGPLYSSRIATVELRRAVMRLGEQAAADQAEVVLGVVRLIELDDEMSRTAGTLQPATMRTLDAVHLAAALALGDECDAFVSYDARLNAAAKVARLDVQSPT